MKSLLLSTCLALACATAHGAEPVPAIEVPAVAQIDDTAAVAAAPAPAVVPGRAAAVPEPGVLPMLAIGIVLVLLRLGRKGRSDIFK